MSEETRSARVNNVSECSCCPFLESMTVGFLSWRLVKVLFVNANEVGDWIDPLRKEWICLDSEVKELKFLEL